MLISRLDLYGFRNYETFSIEPASELTILVGPNAVGKTNAIEAIQILTTGKSFRNPKWPDVVRWGDSSARLTLRADDDGVPLAVEMDVSAGGVRTFRLNGATKRRYSDVVGRIPCVVFTPDDLSLAKGPAENRRSALDGVGEQLSKTFSSIKRDYLKTVRQRNAFLREGGADRLALEAFDEQLITLGTSLTIHRRRLLKRIADPMAGQYTRLSNGERLEISYESRLTKTLPLEDDIGADEVSEIFRLQLRERKRDELTRQTTLVGPHRDDIIFNIDKMDARTFASQGQQRTIALSWKWAEVKTIQDVSHKQPILLLDDVMSELDSERRAALTGLMQRGIQTFVTTTNTGYFEPESLASAKIIEIRTG